MGPGNMFMDENRLIEEDYSPQPTYHALRYLIKDKLRTRESGTTGANGQFAFRGFHGLYRLTVTRADGKVTECEFTLTAHRPHIAIRCSDEA